MEIRVLTLRYSPSLGAIDDAPLVRPARDHEVLGVREHFFIVHDIPHLLCVVTCQPSTIASRTAVPAVTHAASTMPPSAPYRSLPPPTNSSPSNHSFVFGLCGTEQWRG